MAKLFRNVLRVRGVSFGAFGVTLGAFWAHFGSLLGSFLRPWGAWGGLGAHFSDKVDPVDVGRDFLDALGRSWESFGSM